MTTTICLWYIIYIQQPKRDNDYMKRSCTNRTPVRIYLSIMIYVCF